MANIKDNKKGFKVIQISRKELVEELGQYGAIGICDYCNETASTSSFLLIWITLNPFLLSFIFAIPFLFYSQSP